MYRIRPLTLHDIPNLTKLNPSFTATTVIKVEKQGQPPFATWLLREEPLATPFNKGREYDFDATERRNIRNRLLQPNTLIEIITRISDERIVGILDMEERDWNNTAWIWNIMLDTSLRRQGFGRQLMEHAITWSRQRDLRAIMLETQTNNPAACRFYAQMGFQLVGLNDMFYTNDDIARNEVALFWAYPL